MHAVEDKITTGHTKVADLIAELDELNSRARSSAATVQKINSTLERVGFTNFKLAKSSTSEEAYTIEHDGHLLEHNTLSEGERTFITFLYYYWMLRSSDSATRDPRPTVAVIDDPISSLDSNILWVICQLIRNLMANVTNKTLSLTRIRFTRARWTSVGV